MTIGWYDFEHLKIRMWQLFDPTFKIEDFKEEFFPYWGNKLEPLVIRHTLNWILYAFLTLLAEAGVVGGIYNLIMRFYDTTSQIQAGQNLLSIL